MTPDLLIHNDEILQHDILHRYRNKSIKKTSISPIPSSLDHRQGLPIKVADIKMSKITEIATKYLFKVHIFNNLTFC